MEFYIKPALVWHVLHFIFYRKKLVRISLYNFFYEGILCKMNPEKFQRNSFIKEIIKKRKKERKKERQKDRKKEKGRKEERKKEMKGGMEKEREEERKKEKKTKAFCTLGVLHSSLYPA